VSTPCFNEWLQRWAPTFAADEPVDETTFYEYAFSPSGMAAVLEGLGFRVLQIRPYAALDTLQSYGGWRVPRHLKDALAFGLDYVPVIRNWGSTCIWVAQKA
jgi:hypothetical protein